MVDDGRCLCQTYLQFMGVWQIYRTSRWSYKPTEVTMGETAPLLGWTRTTAYDEAYSKSMQNLSAPELSLRGYNNGLYYNIKGNCWIQKNQTWHWKIMGHHPVLPTQRSFSHGEKYFSNLLMQMFNDFPLQNIGQFFFNIANPCQQPDTEASKQCLIFRGFSLLAAERIASVQWRSWIQRSPIKPNRSHIQSHGVSSILPKISARGVYRTVF